MRLRDKIHEVEADRKRRDEEETAARHRRGSELAQEVANHVGGDLLSGVDHLHFRPVPGSYRETPRGEREITVDVEDAFERVEYRFIYRRFGAGPGDRELHMQHLCSCGWSVRKCDDVPNEKSDSGDESFTPVRDAQSIVRVVLNPRKCPKNHR